MNYENVVITTKQNGASEILSNEYTMNSSEDFSIIEKIDKLLINDLEIEKLKR